MTATPAESFASEQRAVTRNIWLMLFAVTLFTGVGSTVSQWLPPAQGNDEYVIYTTYGACLLSLLGGLYAVVVMGKFVSPARTLRSIGGRSWAFKTAIALLTVLIAGALSVTCIPLYSLLSDFGDTSEYAMAGVPVALYTSLILFVVALLALHLRIHALPDVPGSAASMVNEATKDNLEESAIAAIREVVTRISGETDDERVMRVSKVTAPDRVDFVLDRIRDRDTTLVSVVPFNLESDGVVGNTVSIGGSRLIAADGCKSVTYTLNWVADMVKVNGEWKLYGVRGVEAQGE